MTPQSPAQLGICSWSTHASNPDELSERLGQIGLKKVQLALNGVGTPGSPWQGVKERLNQEGYEIVSGMIGMKGESYASLESIRRTGGVLPDEHWPANKAAAEAAAALAEKLNITKISTHAGFLPDDPTDPRRRIIGDRLKVIARIFADHNLELLFETGQESAVNLLSFLEDLHAAGHTNVGVNFDPANMILYNMGDPVDSLARLAPHVRQVHIKDAVATQTPGTWGKEVAIGDGQVDWEGFMRVLAENDYTGHMIIEREAGADRVGDVKLAIQRMTAMMAKTNK